MTDLYFINKPVMLPLRLVCERTPRLSVIENLGLQNRKINRGSL
jgi:hypothetical protein